MGQNNTGTGRDIYSATINFFECAHISIAGRVDVLLKKEYYDHQGFQFKTLGPGPGVLTLKAFANSSPGFGLWQPWDRNIWITRLTLSPLCHILRAMKPSPQVAVVVVSYNTKDLLLTCLASVIESSKPDETEIIVVDNASSDGSHQAVQSSYPQAIIIANPSNVGFGVACNQAIRASSAPFLLLLNSDASITSEGFQALYETISANPRCGAAGCRLTDSAGLAATNTRNFLTPLNQALEQSGLVGWTDWKYLRRTHQPSLDQSQQDCSVDWIDGACLMLRRAALDQVGLFDEKFFMYSEDEDLCFRLRKNGWLICYTARGLAQHHGGASTAQNRFAMRRQFYWSQTYFLTKHFGPASAFCYRVAMIISLGIKSLLGANRTASREQLRALKSANLVNGEW
jgi:GT2 family glycosyltransferase